MAGSQRERDVRRKDSTNDKMDNQDNCHLAKFIGFDVLTLVGSTPTGSPIRATAVSCEEKVLCSVGSSWSGLLSPSIQ